MHCGTDPNIETYKIPVDPEKFKRMVFFPALASWRLDQVIKERKKIQNTKQYELISSDYFELLMNDSNYVRCDDPLSAILSFTNKVYGGWKIMPIEMINDRLKNLLIDDQNLRPGSSTINIYIIGSFMNSFWISTLIYKDWVRDKK